MKTKCKCVVRIAGEDNIKILDEYQTKYCSLHAAAPELLEALKNLLPIGYNDNVLSAVYEKDFIAAEKAIAKATEGREGTK